jgi:hypothetical protein
MAKDISKRDDHLPISRGEVRSMIVEIGKDIMAPIAEGMLSLMKSQAETNEKLSSMSNSLEELAKRSRAQSSSYLGGSNTDTDWDEHERNAHEAYGRRQS